MKNKKMIIILTSVVVLIGSIFLTYNIYQNKNKVNKAKRKRQNNLAIMIKDDEATEYIKSSSRDIPKGNYTLNREKSYCKNNGIIGDYDSDLGKISFSFIGTDSCYLYFDFHKIKLYETIENRYNEDKTYLGLYTGEGADTYANPVYYYKGNVQNNNVLFGGFCWKIVRTTETGGVKIVYNGVQKDEVEISTIEQSSYANVSNDATYPYTFDSTTKTWSSTNKDNSKTGTITFTVDTAGDYYLSYVMSSEAGWDKAIFYKNGTAIGDSNGYSGTESGTISLTGLTTSDVIKVEYTKDGSGANGSDTVTFSIGKAVGEPVKSCDNTRTDSQIGKSAFNSSSNSPAYVGYMYNKVYINSYKKIIDYQYFSGTKAYADSVTYDSSTKKYTLDNTTATTLNVSTSNGNTLVGKYTCNQSTTTATCTNVYYIAGYSSNYIYYYSLSNGDVDGTDNGSNYVFGKSFTYANGSYSLSDTTTVHSDEWATKKTMVNNYHYTCLNNETNCSSIYYINYSSFDYVFYITLTGGKSVSDALNEMLYADDVNKNDSTIKEYIDSWYENNLIDYEDKLEDTVFCNDRSITSLGGWNPNGGNTSSLVFKDYITSNQSLVCANETDRFSMSNSKAKLRHPIGLLSYPELSLAVYGSSHYFNSGEYVWLNSPNYSDSVSINWGLGLEGDVYVVPVENLGGVRPSVSLKPGIKFTAGDGSFTNPFVIE